GGQKQRVAIAGVMAMKPKCIVLDEPTAMLDPNGRKEVIKAVRDLNKAEHVTVILITHYMEEVTGADRIFVMDAGELVMEGTPVEIFSQVEKLRKLRLDVPQVTELAYELKQSGAELPDGILTTDELVHHLCEEKNPIADPKKLKESLQEDIAAESEVREKPQQKNQTAGDGEPEKVQPEKLDIEGGKPEIQAQEDKHTESGGLESLRLEHVSYVYSTGTAYEITALKDVSLEIPKGQFVGIIGHTGSGKSTLVQHFNGLIRPTSGHVYFQGRDIWEEGYPLRELRFHVGLVFQYPEYQLFETDVIKDVCFGPKNQGLSEEEQMKRAREALRQVGIPEGLYEKSPFELSGGQKRRVAIAGVLAMNPDILVLDEPTAGLDPRGREEILSELDQLQKERGITVILVSHSMEDVAQHVDRIIAMNKGEVAFDGTPRQVFSHYKELETMGLAAPQMTYIMHALREHGLDVDVNASTLEEARRTVLQALKEKTA
ncbi:MAG TPA: energy-coupling factor transporter ATPase, partial [Lachnospiraceae bacterium]|nr:energy-coupling factor transporter ATPase [Lachnospiraceae bacterium]